MGFGLGSLGSVGAGLAGVGMFMGGGLPATLALGAQFGQGLFNSYMGYKNYQLQRDQYTYEKGLQEQMMWREDNAVLQRVVDMKNAGINPVLAAGQGASAGPVVSTSAPQMGRIETGMLESAQAVMQMMSMDANIASTYAQTKLLENQSGLVQMQNKKTSAEIDQLNVNTLEKAWNLQQAKDAGVKTGSSGVMGQITDTFNMLKNKMHLRSETAEERAQRLAEEKKLKQITNKKK